MKTAITFLISLLMTVFVGLNVASAQTTSPSPTPSPAIAGPSPTPTTPEGAPRTGHGTLWK